MVTWQSQAIDNVDVCLHVFGHSLFTLKKKKKKS